MKLFHSLSSWVTKLWIMLFERETYRAIRDWTDEYPWADHDNP